MGGAAAGPLARSLVPREHGASMELVFPLLCAFALGPPSWAAIAYATAAILAFVAHEPMLVVLGRRGARQRELVGAAAWRMLALFGGGALALGVSALASLSAEARLFALAPVTLGAATLALSLRGVRERALGVELLVVVTFASVALPVAIDCGATAATALAMLATWSVAHALGTLSARGVLYRQKDGGRLLAATRVASVLVLVLGALGAWLEPAAMAYTLGPAPFAVAGLVLAAAPPPPTRMRALGLALVLASTFTLVVLVAGAR